MYKIIFNKNAVKDLRKLDKNIQKKILEKIKKLSENPFLGIGLKYKLKNFRKLYFQNKKIRVVYEIQDKKLIIEIISIGKRNKSEVYRRVVKRIK